jgi:hypothetical protein
MNRTSERFCTFLQVKNGDAGAGSKQHSKLSPTEIERKMIRCLPFSFFCLSGEMIDGDDGDDGYVRGFI